MKKFKEYDSVAEMALNIKQLTKEQQTDDVCLLAIKNNVWDIKYIHNQKEKYGLLACKMDGSALSEIKAEYQTDAICKIAIKHNPSNFKYIKNQNAELALFGVKLNVPLYLIKGKFQSAKIVMIAIKFNADQVDDITNKNEAIMKRVNKFLKIESVEIKKVRTGHYVVSDAGKIIWNIYQLKLYKNVPDLSKVFKFASFREDADWVVINPLIDYINGDMIKLKNSKDINYFKNRKDANTFIHKK